MSWADDYVAVIWITKYGRRYVVAGGSSPSAEDIKNADKYDRALHEKFKQIKEELAKEKYNKMKAGLEKYHLLGSKLKFLEAMELRKICDPELTLTWRALYDIVPDLSPTGNIPQDKKRAEGDRNHFLFCYRLGKYELRYLNGHKISWRIFNDICMSFTPELWKDERLIEWIFEKVKEKGMHEVRNALIVIRRMSGSKSQMQLDTKMLNKKELFGRLDTELVKLASSSIKNPVV